MNRFTSPMVDRGGASGVLPHNPSHSPHPLRSFAAAGDLNDGVYQAIYRFRGNRHNYPAWPDPEDVIADLRDHGLPSRQPLLFTPDVIAKIEAITPWAIARIRARPQEKQPSPDGRRQFHVEQARKQNHKRRREREERDFYIIEARAQGVPIAAVLTEVALRWPKLAVKARRIKGIATPSAIEGYWWCQGQFAIPRLTTDDSLVDTKHLDSSDSDILDSALHHENDIPQWSSHIELQHTRHWILGCWAANVGVPLSSEVADRLAEYAADLVASENWKRLNRLVDDIIVGWCASGKAKNPAAFLRTCLNNEEQQQLAAKAVQEAVLAMGDRFENAARYIAEADNPVAYLTTCRREARPHGGLSGRSAMGTGLSILKRWAPQLVTPAFEAEAMELMEQERSGHLESYRQRYGRLPWDNPQDAQEEADLEATAVSQPTKLEHPANPAISGETSGTRRGPSHGEALKQVERHLRPRENAGTAAILEHSPCRHPLTTRLTAAMRLDNVAMVDCAIPGCSCRLYSDRGPVQCPCHWPVRRVATLTQALDLQLTGADR